MIKTNSLKILATVLVAGSVFVGCGSDSSSTPETNTTIPETNTTVPEDNTTVPEDNNTSVVPTAAGELLTKDGIISLPTNLVVNPENSTELIQVADVNKTYTISDLKYYSVEGNNTLQAMENNQTVILASELNVTAVSSSSSVSSETNTSSSSFTGGGTIISSSSSSSVANQDVNDSNILPVGENVSSVSSVSSTNAGGEIISSSSSTTSSITEQEVTADNITPF